MNAKIIPGLDANLIEQAKILAGQNDVAAGHLNNDEGRCKRSVSSHPPQPGEERGGDLTNKETPLVPCPGTDDHNGQLSATSACNTDDRLNKLPIADWVLQISQGAAEYPAPRSRKYLTKAFFASR
jgi:hypothetical protein